MRFTQAGGVFRHQHVSPFLAHVKPPREAFENATEPQRTPNHGDAGWCDDFARCTARRTACPSGPYTSLET
jgi:hypothetical protein